MAREDRRDRRGRSDSFHNDRVNDLAAFAGFIGFVIGIYSLGRASAPGSHCCDDLVRADLRNIQLQQTLASCPGCTIPPPTP